MTCGGKLDIYVCVRIFFFFLILLLLLLLFFVFR